MSYSGVGLAQTQNDRQLNLKPESWHNLTVYQSCYRISYIQYFGFHDHNFRDYLVMSHSSVYGANILFSLVTMTGI